VARQDQELIPMNEQRKKRPGEGSGQPGFSDPETNISYCFMECHLSNSFAKIMGNSRAQHAGAVERSLVTRIVTNWMGDDAFCRKIYWRPLKDTFIGDTFIGRGRIKGKRIVKEEHLVDLEVYCEDITGVLTTMADVSVSLMSKTAHTQKSPKVEDSKETLKENVFLPGDRIRIKDKADWPEPFACTGAEAEVCQWSNKHDFFKGFQNFIFMKITKSDNPEVLGSEITLHSDLIEKL